MIEQKSNWTELNIDDITYIKFSLWKRLFSSEDPTYNLVMSNKDNASQQLRMVIGKYEAQAIAITMEQMTPSRPLIQEVFKSVIDKMGAKLESIFIDKIDDGRYHSTIRYINSSKVIEIDARPADSIAMALRHKAPIYIETSLFKDYSVKR